MSVSVFISSKSIIRNCTSREGAVITWPENYRQNYCPTSSKIRRRIVEGKYVTLCGRRIFSTRTSTKEIEKNSTPSTKTMHAHWTKQRSVVYYIAVIGVKVFMRAANCQQYHVCDCFLKLDSNLWIVAVHMRLALGQWCGLCERFKTEHTLSVCGACSNLLYWQSQNHYSEHHHIM